MSFLKLRNKILPRSIPSTKDIDSTEQTDLFSVDDSLRSFSESEDESLDHRETEPSISSRVANAPFGIKTKTKGCEGGRIIKNWAETNSYDASKFRFPETIQELRQLVLDSSEIRCAGAMHSCAPLLASDGIIISLEKFNQILDIDINTSMVTIQAGVKCHDLCEEIATHGLAMGTLGSIDWQTVVGAVMTGTHGGSLTTPCLHDFVQSYTLLKADGEIITVDRDTESVIFSALAPSMGVFGIVVELKLRCTKIQYLEASMTALPFDEMIPRFDDIMKTNKYCRIIIYPSIKQATIWTANPVEKGSAAAKGAYQSDTYVNFRNENEKSLLQQFLQHHNDSDFELADQCLHKVLKSQLKRLSHYEARYNHVLCLERNNGIPHADIEFAFDNNDSIAVLETVRDYCNSKRVPYYNFEIRTTKKDDAMLSCCHGRDTMWIDFQAKSDVSAEFFGEMQNLLSPFGFRKHWAKGMDHSKLDYLLHQFPKLTDWMLLVHKMDPDGKFRNNHFNMWFKKTMEALEKQGRHFPNHYVPYRIG